MKKGKNRRKKEKRKKKVRINPPSYSWQDKEGFHFLTPGRRPSPEEVAEMTRQYQEKIRNSPLWDQMLARFGKEEAEELLKQCQVKVD